MNDYKITIEIDLELSRQKIVIALQKGPLQFIEYIRETLKKAAPDIVQEIMNQCVADPVIKKQRDTMITRLLVEELSRIHKKNG